MPISDTGDLNLSGLSVPDAYIGITPPGPVVQGVNSGVTGFVGVGSWGPVNMALISGNIGGVVANHGPLTVRKGDIVTHVYLAALQGAADFRTVRVTDGTDTHASYTLASADLNGSPIGWNTVAAAINLGQGVQRNASALVRFDPITGIFNAIYSGVYGNTIYVNTSAGSKNGTLKVKVSAIATPAEVYDNISVDHMPPFASHVLSGGTDGDAGVTPAMLVGDDSLATGMYALREQGMAFFELVDCVDSATWTTQAAFAKSEATLAVITGPAGDTIAAAVARKNAVGLDDWRVWLLHGDFLWFADPSNGMNRLVSPQACAIGRAVNLSPERSPLNKPLNGIIGSQRVGGPGASTVSAYSRAELAVLANSGIDVITNPAPRGKVWAARMGHNSSSDATRHSLPYGTMTNFISRSLLPVVGQFIGEVISQEEVRQANAAFNGFFANLQALGMIGGLSTAQPWKVVCDLTNNPQDSTGLGFLRAKIQVQYLGIIEKFVVDYQGGGTVTLG